MLVSVCLKKEIYAPERERERESSRSEGKTGESVRLYSFIMWVMLQ